MSYEPKTTTDHNTIREWTEQRGGQPSQISQDEADEDTQEGRIRINFGSSIEDPLAGKNMEQISWDEFFQQFEDDNLMFLYQEETEEGEISQFYKFVRRN